MQSKGTFYVQKSPNLVNISGNSYGPDAYSFAHMGMGQLYAAQADELRGSGKGHSGPSAVQAGGLRDSISDNRSNDKEGGNYHPLLFCLSAYLSLVCT